MEKSDLLEELDYIVNQLKKQLALWEEQCHKVKKIEEFNALENLRITREHAINLISAAKWLLKS